MSVKTLLLILLLSVLAACGSHPPPEPAKTVVVKENKVPGTVDHFWVEPMYDTVRVPAQLDPTGTYYRPSHKTVVEIRPERFQKVQFDGDKPQEPKGDEDKGEKAMNRKSKIIKPGVLVVSVLLLGFAACHKQQKPQPDNYVVVTQPAEPPAGTVRYCWEEPKVQYEPNGPGVDAEGKWYHPRYLAVREAKQGRWVPCKQ